MFIRIDAGGGDDSVVAQVHGLDAWSSVLETIHRGGIRRASRGCARPPPSTDRRERVQVILRPSRRRWNERRHIGEQARNVDGRDGPDHNVGRKDVIIRHAFLVVLFRLVDVHHHGWVLHVLVILGLVFNMRFPKRTRTDRSRNVLVPTATLERLSVTPRPPHGLVNLSTSLETLQPRSSALFLVNHGLELLDGAETGGEGSQTRDVVGVLGSLSKGKGGAGRQGGEVGQGSHGRRPRVVVVVDRSGRSGRRRGLAVRTGCAVV